MSYLQWWQRRRLRVGMCTTTSSSGKQETSAEGITRVVGGMKYTKC
ncbi:hypothetical protein BDA96_08G124200 [Sorghum bicolor]|uniref:Uncharacterized protein n=1 Tax=Sorghum bicolor TaxID=4558 RepID=A0A921QIG4_SORBI|nr:hypothetical protein BDA96_08G124200 [Sorghum bicolor]